MNRNRAWLCVAAMLALCSAGCTSKSDQAAPPADAGGQAARAGAPDPRTGAEATRENAARVREGSDRLREAVGKAETPAPPAAQPPAAQAPAEQTPPAAGEAAAPEEQGAVGAPPVGRKGGSLRSRTARLRGSAADLRARVGGAGEAPAAESPGRAAPPRETTRAVPPAREPAAPAPARESARPAAPPREPAAAAPRASARPVDPNELAALLPSMPGSWKRSRIDANTLSSPVVVSAARVTYRQGGGYVRIEIVDSAGNQAAMAYLTASRPRGSRSVGSDGYERSSTFAGYPSWETWQNAQQHGSLNVVVANRFLVSYTGHGIASAEILTDLGQRTDLRRLEALR